MKLLKTLNGTRFSNVSVLLQLEINFVSARNGYQIVRTLVQLMTFARWLRLWLITRSQLVSLRALLLASAPLAGICSGSSLLMAHLAARLSRRALLLCFFEVAGLADGVRPFAFSRVFFSCSSFSLTLLGFSLMLCRKKKKKRKNLHERRKKHI